ncbi:MAG TPA: prepilin-type N-terminal cleavage/methylation domain-containing protein [Candidatus Saccharimonadales bacterium]|nr:prepilin-type N-terminal cleavage/methylation domain-containing protein [Candidatus Saccharimonadales bacterium]
MTLTNIKKMKDERGFTIVELLIVIVVIAILAAITIVAYNGIQQRAHTTAQKTSAENLAKKIEAFNAVNNAYPKYDTSGNITTALNGLTDSSLQGSGITIGTPSASTGDGTVQLRLCTAASPVAGTTVPTGYGVFIWDSTASPAGLSPVQAGGNATISGTNISCSGTGSTTVTTVS